ncbi:MAG TPA: glycoside hydrolase family 6 protein [Polyangiaceae bacterium]
MTSRWLSLPLIALAASACSYQKNTQPANVAPAAAQPSAAALPPVVVEPSPFMGAELFRDPAYVAKVEAAAKADKANADLIRKVANYPTAIWLDSIASVSRIGKLLDAAEKQNSNDKPVLVTFVIYDLPNRDCSAKASAGELDAEKGGAEKYKTDFIDKIAEKFALHPKLRIVAIVEPDSLGNLATNMNVPKCAASDQVYRSSIAYAIQKLHMPQVSTYLDAAHAGWLGWEANRPRIAKIFKDVLTQAGDTGMIRGFATNVSNYNTVAGSDGKKLGPANPCSDESTYVTKLTNALEIEGIRGKRFVIDTSRNGKVVRATWGSWCNVKGAGIGPRPQASPLPLVDAYFWVKPPGESDGTSDPKATRFDANCASPDSMPNAPEAGQWFSAHFLEMAKNADPAL